MSKNHEQFMVEAIRLSRENMQLNAGGPFGAVIVQNGAIVGRGWNKVTSKNDPTAHAEVEAIRDACQNLNTFDLTGCEIYTSCEPCPMCLSAIYWARLGQIYYGNTRVDAAQINFDDDMIYQEIPKPMDQRKIPMLQVSQEKAIEVFREWQAKLDKTHY